MGRKAAGYFDAGGAFVVRLSDGHERAKLGA
jgi:hypothetical protein